jgi:MFS transporter, DHA1 family, multidrug resistance protein
MAINIDTPRTGKPVADLHPVEFIALMAFILLLTAVAIDIMLPAFDELREYFELPPESTAVAQIVTFFFLGQIGQLIFGPLSDRFGRIPILRLGFVLYIIGCVAAAFAPSLDLILAARFVVGMGAAAMSVCATASVRDRFAGDQMARTMSLILTIFLGVPIVAPLFGAFILSISSWQAVFLTPPLIAVFVFIWSFRLRESLRPENRRALNVTTLAQSARQVLTNRRFVRYTAVTTILFSVFISNISSSERIIGEIYGRPELFILIFSGTGLLMAIFTFLNSRLVDRFGARRVVRTLIIVYLATAVLLVLLTLTQNGLPNIFLFFALVSLQQGINVAVEPDSGAMAMEPLGAVAGMAAAVYGTTFLVLGSVIGSFIDRQLVDRVAPLSIAYVIAGVFVIVLVYTDRIRVSSSNQSVEPVTPAASGASAD